MKIEIQPTLRCKSRLLFRQTISFIIIAFLLNAPTKAEVCQDCQNVLEYQCKSCSSYCSEQKMSTFRQCTYLNCTQNRKSLCQNYESLPPNVTADSCNRNCCAERIPLPSVIYNRCLTKQSFDPYMVIYGLAGFAGVVLLGIAIVILFRKYKANKLPCIKNSEKSEKDSDSNIQQQGNKYLESTSTSALEDQKIRQENCSICLQGNLDTMTSCKHYFHIVCLANWYKRNYTCPLCKNEQINPVIIHCEKCKRKCKRKSIFKVMNQWEFLGKASGILCAACSNV